MHKYTRCMHKNCPILLRYSPKGLHHRLHFHKVCSSIYPEDVQLHELLSSVVLLRILPHRGSTLSYLQFSFLPVLLTKCSWFFSRIPLHFSSPLVQSFKFCPHPAHQVTLETPSVRLLDPSIVRCDGGVKKCSRADGVPLHPSKTSRYAGWGHQLRHYNGII